MSLFSVDFHYLVMLDLVLVIAYPLMPFAPIITLPLSNNVSVQFLLTMPLFRTSFIIAAQQQRQQRQNLTNPVINNLLNTEINGLRFKTVFPQKRQQVLIDQIFPGLYFLQIIPLLLSPLLTFCTFIQLSSHSFVKLYLCFSNSLLIFSNHLIFHFSIFIHCFQFN